MDSVKVCLSLILFNAALLPTDNVYKWYNTCSTWLLILEYQPVFCVGVVSCVIIITTIYYNKSAFE